MNLKKRRSIPNTIALVVIVIGFFALIYVIWYLYSDSGPFGMARKRDEVARQSTEKMNTVLEERKAATSCLLDALDKFNAYKISHPKASQSEILKIGKDFEEECNKKYPQFAPASSQ